MGVLTDHGNSSLSAFSTQSWSLTPSTTRGRNKAEAVGITVFVLRGMSLCNGLDPMVSTGVFLYSNRASYGSLPSRSAFLKRFLVTW